MKISLSTVLGLLASAPFFSNAHVADQNAAEKMVKEEEKSFSLAPGLRGAGRLLEQDRFLAADQNAGTTSWDMNGVCEADYSFRRCSPCGSGGCSYDAFASTQERIDSITFSAGDVDKNKVIVLTKSVPTAFPVDEADRIAQIELTSSGNVYLETIDETFTGYTTSYQFRLRISGYMNDKVSFTWGVDTKHVFDNPTGEYLFASIWFKETGASMTATAFFPPTGNLAQSPSQSPTASPNMFNELQNIVVSNDMFRKSGTSDDYDAYAMTTESVSEVTFFPGDTDKHKRMYLTTSKPDGTGLPSSGVVAMVGLFDRKRIYIEDPTSDETVQFINGYDTGDQFVLRSDYDTSEVWLFRNGEKLHTFTNLALDLYASIWMYEPDGVMTATALPGDINQEIAFQANNNVQASRSNVFQKVAGDPKQYDAYAKTSGTSPVKRLYFSGGDTTTHKRLVLTTTPVGAVYPSTTEIVVMIGLFNEARIYAEPSSVAGEKLQWINGYTEEDDFILDIVSDKVNFYKNDSLLHSFQNPVGSDLHASIWFYEMGGALNVRAY